MRLLKGMFRTLLLGLDKQIQGRIPLDHPAVSWLVLHAAHVRNLRVVGADGKTPFQRARGTCSVPALLGFGEVCRYRKRAQEKGIGSSTSTWSTGVWLGLDRKTGQYIVFDKQLGGIRHARTVMPMPQSQQWSIERLQEIDITPWAKFEGPAPVVVPREQPRMTQRRLENQSPGVCTSASETWVFTDIPRSALDVTTYENMARRMPSTTTPSVQTQVVGSDLQD